MDLKLDTSYDLAIAGGDFVIADTEQQEVDLILRTNQGEWKNSPLTGCNLFQYLNANYTTTNQVIKNIKQQLQLDGKKDYTVAVKNNDIIVTK